MLEMFDDIDLGLNFNNFDPEDLQTDETINAVFVVDISSSINSYEKDLNNAFNDFIADMQKSHIASKLLVSVVVFNSSVSVLSGFQPVHAIAPSNFKGNGCTALYDAVGQGIKIACDYRSDLESTGVNVKTLVFIITDGEDNSSKQYNPATIAAKLAELKKEEMSSFSFSTIFFGVGPYESEFRRVAKSMGIEHVAVMGTDAKEIRKMIGFISQSISKSASNAGIGDVGNF